MIKLSAQVLATAALSVLPLLAVAPAHAQAPAEVLTLTDAIERLPLAAESRDGYQRTKFKHWVDADKDSCNTRQEVLESESLVPVTVEAGCKVIAGEWYSYYDGVTLTAPGGLDIDHMVSVPATA